MGFAIGSDSKESAMQEMSKIDPQPRKIPREWNSNPLQLSCLENPWTERLTGCGHEIKEIGHDVVTNRQQPPTKAVFRKYILKKNFQCGN